MDINNLNQQRKILNNLMENNDDFFKEFGNLDDKTYSSGAIPKKYKELMGLAISVLSKCDECILYHIQGCISTGVNKDEMIEAIKIGVIGGGSITYPNARYAFSILKELKIID
ncbi:MAG: carboxymuconolactone decarboxylase family protein [Patescibacteria group bacterium]|jgi:AhpD family alkylhydroperoxidase